MYPILTKRLHLLSVAMFTVAGEHLTLRMRKLAFAAMLKQEMGWFDQPTNNTGALCSRLSADAAAIQGVSFVRGSVRGCIGCKCTVNFVVCVYPFI